MPPKRALWSEDDLISAVRAVQRGAMSTYTAAERYKVPRTFAASILTEAPAPDAEQENVPALQYPRVQAPGSGDTTPSIISEASTPDLDEENVPHIDNPQKKTPQKKNSSKEEPGDTSPSILTQISIPDVLEENIPPDGCRRPVTPKQANKQSPALASTSTRQILKEKTVQLSFNRTVYSSSSSEESDDLPLSKLKRNEFYDLMPTPVKIQTKTPTVRRKAINYRGTPITKDLFDKYNEEKINSKEMKDNKRKNNKLKEKFEGVKGREGAKVNRDRTEKRKSKKTLNPKRAKIVSAKKSTTIKGTPQKQESWYCHACEEDRMDDAMRQCSRCSKWYHEECVGLSKEDTDEFQCPGGCE